MTLAAAVIRWCTNDVTKVIHIPHIPFGWLSYWQRVLSHCCTGIMIFMYWYSQFIYFNVEGIQKIQLPSTPTIVVGLSSLYCLYHQAWKRWCYFCSLWVPPMYLNQPTTESVKEIVVTGRGKRSPLSMFHPRRELKRKHQEKNVCSFIYAQTRHREGNRRRRDLFPHIRQNSKLIEIQKKNLPALVAFQSEAKTWKEKCSKVLEIKNLGTYDKVSNVVESWVQWRSDFQSGSRVLTRPNSWAKQVCEIEWGHWTLDFMAIWFMRWRM